MGYSFCTMNTPALILLRQPAPNDRHYVVINEMGAYWQLVGWTFVDDSKPLPLLGRQLALREAERLSNLGHVIKVQHAFTAELVWQAKPVAQYASAA